MNEEKKNKFLIEFIKIKIKNCPLYKTIKIKDNNNMIELTLGHYILKLITSS